MAGVGWRGWGELVGPGSCGFESRMTDVGLARESRLVFERSSTIVDTVGVDWN